MNALVAVIFSIVFIGAIEAQDIVGSTKQTLQDNVNQFVNGMNSELYALRTNAQNHYDNSVRTLTEALRRFNINANRAPFAVADKNRSGLQQCLVGVRDTMENVLESLKKSANSPIFDYSVSTETKIESNLKNQTDTLKQAIESKTDDRCLKAVGITNNSMNSKYKNYSDSLRRCINALSFETNSNIVSRFNPKHFPALALLNRIRINLDGVRTPAQVNSFMTNNCTPQVIQQFSEVKTSAEEVMINATKEIDECYDQARPLLPPIAPFLVELDKCT